MFITHPRLAHAMLQLRPGLRPLMDYEIVDVGAGPVLVSSAPDLPTQADIDAVSEADLDRAQRRKRSPRINVDAAAVKQEARRRILERYPDWKQTNMVARSVELQDIWRQVGSWTPEERAEADALTAAWAWIKAIRAASDEIEAMTPIPADFAADARWAVNPAVPAAGSARPVAEVIAAMAAEITTLKAALASLVQAAQGQNP